MRSTHYQSDKPERHHLTPMGDPAGYLDEGKGLPWIIMDTSLIGKVLHLHRRSSTCTRVTRARVTLAFASIVIVISH